MLATYVRGGSLTHVREPPVPYWTTQRLQAYRVPTPRSSAWRPPATQAFTTPSDMRLRFALRTVGMAMGPPLARGCHLCQQRCWRSRCPRAPRVRRRRPVPRCGAVRGDATVFVVALQARRQPASQPASQAGVRRSVPRHGTYWRWPTEDGRCAAVLLRASSFNTSTHLGSVAELQSRSRSRPKNISRAALAQ